MILTLMCIGVFVIGVAALVVNGKFKFSWRCLTQHIQLTLLHGY